MVNVRVTAANMFLEYLTLVEYIISIMYKNRGDKNKKQ